MAYLDIFSSKLAKEEDVAKKKMLIAEEEKHMDGLLMLLGKTYYETRGELGEEDFAYLVKQIKESAQKLEELAESDPLPLCSACGKPLVEDGLFCCYCGTKIEEQIPSVADEAETAIKEEPASTENICAECGAAVEAGVNFCTNCGSKMSASASPAFVFCTKCGSKVFENEKFCTMCGTRAER